MSHTPMMCRTIAAMTLAALAVASPPASAQQLTSTSATASPMPVGSTASTLTSARIARAPEAEPQNWTTYYGSYEGQRYSRLNQIDAGNVNRLAVAWTKKFDRTQAFEATPLVVDGIMYLTTAAPISVYALDAKDGREIWHYDSPDSGRGKPICCGRVNRGVALAGGQVFFVTLDATLHSLDARTGRALWSTPFGDPARGYSGTLAPLVVGNKVLVGVSGGEYGIRGYIDAYDITSGKRAWRFWTIPGPGQPGHDSWGGTDIWQTGGGPAWVTGTYDPALGLVYWGTGNPGPDFNGAVRPGDNLYTSSIVALDAETGKLRWHYQTTPHDVYDYDAVGVPVLADLDIGGRQVKALLQANKNGFFYALDRSTGKLLFAQPFARQTWTKGIDMASGRPMVAQMDLPAPAAKPECPGPNGATEWNHMAFSPATHMAYVPVIENCATYRSAQPFYVPGMPFWGGEYDLKALGPGESHGHLAAIDATTGKAAWTSDSKWPVVSNVLATAGNVVFWTEANGTVHAVNARTGAMLWHHKTETGIRSGPMTYAVDGRQYVAVPVGWGGPVVPELAEQPTAQTLMVFALPPR